MTITVPTSTWTWFCYIRVIPYIQFIKLTSLCPASNSKKKKQVSGAPFEVVWIQKYIVITSLSTYLLLLNVIGSYLKTTLHTKLKIGSYNQWVHWKYSIIHYIIHVKHQGWMQMCMLKLCVTDIHTRILEPELTIVVSSALARDRTLVSWPRAGWPQYYQCICKTNLMFCLSFSFFKSCKQIPLKSNILISVPLMTYQWSVRTRDDSGHCYS